jgi:hypothetical protein
MAVPVAMGDPVNLPTLASWAIALIGLGIAALVIFNREDM